MAEVRASGFARMNPGIAICPTSRRSGLLALAWSHRSCSLQSRGRVVSNNYPWGYRDLPSILLTVLDFELGKLREGGGPLVLEPFRQVSSIYVRRAHRSAIRLAAISVLWVLHPNFSELPGGVWMLLHVDGPDPIGHCALLWRCPPGWQWCPSNFFIFQSMSTW